MAEGIENTISTLKVNVSMDQNTINFTCDECDCRFKMIRGLRNHMQTHSNIVQLDGNMTLQVHDSDPETSDDKTESPCTSNSGDHKDKETSNDENSVIKFRIGVVHYDQRFANINANIEQHCDFGCDVTSAEETRPEGLRSWPPEKQKVKEKNSEKCQTF